MREDDRGEEKEKDRRKGNVDRDDDESRGIGVLIREEKCRRGRREAEIRIYRVKGDRRYNARLNTHTHTHMYARTCGHADRMSVTTTRYLRPEIRVRSRVKKTSGMHRVPKCDPARTFAKKGGSTKREREGERKTEAVGRAGRKKEEEKTATLQERGERRTCAISYPSRT